MTEAFQFSEEDCKQMLTPAGRLRAWVRDYGALNISFADDLEAVLAENERLRKGIREHRDQHGDNRCFLDDRKLYKLLGESVPGCELPPHDEMMESCRRYSLQRRGGTLGGGRTIAQLEEEVRQLQDMLGEFVIGTPCSLYGDFYCEEHSEKTPCPHEAAKQLLSRLREGDQ